MPRSSKKKAKKSDVNDQMKRLERRVRVRAEPDTLEEDESKLIADSIWS